MQDIIRIKPHHFVDIITYYGAGTLRLEPHPYGHAVHTIAKRVLDQRDVTLQMELGADDICAPCIHNLDGICDDVIDTSFRPDAPALKREYNLLIDRRWCERLKLAQGDRLTARAFCERLRDLDGDLSDIYLEMPAESTAERARNLRAGAIRFLSG